MNGTFALPTVTSRRNYRCLIGCQAICKVEQFVIEHEFYTELNIILIEIDEPLVAFTGATS